MSLKQFLAIASLTILPTVIFGQEKPEPEYLNVAYAYDRGSNKLINLERENASPAAKARVFGGINGISEVPGSKS
jgi:hypothetical protein